MPEGIRWVSRRAHPTLVGWRIHPGFWHNHRMSEMTRILVIEDQAPMRRNIALMLELEGYEVATAANGREGLLAAVQARLTRAAALDAKVQDAAASASYNPDFSSPGPLQRQLGLTGREADVLLWVAQGKSNGDVAIILEMSEKTVKQHLGSVFQKIGVESRTAATVRALEVLSGPKAF